MDPKNLYQAEYAHITSWAQSSWSQDAGVGKLIGAPEGYSKIALSVGSQFQATPALGELFENLSTLAAKDKSLLMIAPANLHFTFLALTNHQWSRESDIPATLIKEVLPLANNIESFAWTLQELKLVAGPNFLLLAGTPSAEAIAARRAFCEAILRSKCATLTKERYANQAFPPILWHTTLCRSTYERFPKLVRDFNAQNQNKIWGNLELPRPLVRTVNYDWSFNSVVA